MPLLFILLLLIAAPALAQAEKYVQPCLYERTPEATLDYQDSEGNRVVVPTPPPVAGHCLYFGQADPKAAFVIFQEEGSHSYQKVLISEIKKLGPIEKVK